MDTHKEVGIDRKTLLIVIGALILMITMTQTIKAAPNGADLTKVGSERGTNSSVSSVSAQAGNVTEMNIEQVRITDIWAGFYGSVTGEIILADSGANRFYNWSDASPTGEVYASRDGAVAWASIACAQPANINTEQSGLNISGTDTDNITNTFTKTTHDTFDIGDTSFSVDQCNYTTNAYGDTGAQSSTWDEVMLWDGADSVYSVIIGQDQTGFDSGTYDFELLIPTNKSQSVTQYYFYVEIT